MEHREEHKTIVTAVVGSTHLPLVNSRVMNVTTVTKKVTLPQRVERERQSKRKSEQDAQAHRVKEECTGDESPDEYMLY